MAVALSPVGTLLAHWRRQRRKSQLALSHEAGVSARHVELRGERAGEPSREMVILLARALDVPLRERNRCCSPPATRRCTARPGSTPPELAQVRARAGPSLRHHEPYPAVVMDRHWDVLADQRRAPGRCSAGCSTAPRRRGRPTSCG